MEERSNKGAAEAEPCKRCAELEKAIDALRCELAAGRSELEASSRSAEIAREVFQSIPSGIVICQYQPPGELFCLCANPEAVRLTEIDSNAFSGAELDEIWPSARGQGLTQSLVDTAKSGRSLSIDRAYYRNGNRHAVFRVRAVPLGGNRLCVAFEDSGALESAAGTLAAQSSKVGGDRVANETKTLRSRIRDLEEEILHLKSEK